jgi:predicted MPP superfamily phosphohydrolase
MILLRIGIFLTFIALLFLTQRFWFIGVWRLIAEITLPWLRSALQVSWFCALIVFVLAFFDPLFGHILSRVGGGKWIIAAARLWLVTSIVAFLAIQLVRGVGWIYGLIASGSSAPVDESRRNFFRYASYIVGGLPFVVAVYGFAAGRLKYRVERVEVPIANLPKELDGFKIAQLSDIHIGDFMPREEVRRAVNIANDLKPDLAVVTGDFISNEFDPLGDCIAELSKLRAPLGTWGCNGNHEIYADAEDAAQGLFQQHGMKLLRQENVQLDWRGTKLNLIGVDYQRDHMTKGPAGPMLQGIEPLISREHPNILLSHNPNSFHRAAEMGIELSLAGHTHGGQVKVEIVDHSFSPARLITDFVAGLYHLPMGKNGSGENSNGRKAALYVNRGLGTFGVPMRIGVLPEITLLTLRSA